MSNIFKPGTIVRKSGRREEFVYIGYNSRTDRHEIAIVGQKTEAKAEQLERA